ncbi:hypothetical protein E9993_15890 [Labilibacter sediminis]|nr:hypothetical protein E9993_15890 [Labilibacter sediminis]
MKREVLLFMGVIVLTVSFGQEKEYLPLRVGFNAEYTYSGKTNSAITGPAFFFEPDNENKLYHFIATGAGVYWGKHGKTSAMTSTCYNLGRLPGLMFGISSQQYYNIETKYNTFKTDVRLSGEIYLALFGFIGYRYQHPLIKNNEAQYLSRHAFFFKIPLPL